MKANLTPENPTQSATLGHFIEEYMAKKKCSETATSPQKKSIKVITPSKKVVIKNNDQRPSAIKEMLKTGELKERILHDH